MDELSKAGKEFLDQAEKSGWDREAMRSDDNVMQESDDSDRADIIKFKKHGVAPLDAYSAIKEVNRISALCVLKEREASGASPSELKQAEQTMKDTVKEANKNALEQISEIYGVKFKKKRK